MTRSINKVILLGHLGRDPAPHTTPGGRLVVNFTVATNRARRDTTGERSEETEWFRVAVWDQLAQTAEQYLRKGARVYLEGRLQTRRYRDKDNVERTAVEIVAHDLVLLDRRPDDAAEVHPAQRQVPPPRHPVPPPLAPPSTGIPDGPVAQPAPTGDAPQAWRLAAPPPIPASAIVVPGAPTVTSVTPDTPPQAMVVAHLATAATTEDDYALYDIDDEHAPF